jgi:BASS family bile acid:Na+ symporter
MVVDAAVPALIFLAMAVVGLELTVADFRRVAGRPGTVVAAALGQVVLLPLFGWLLVRSLRLPPTVAQGALLVAACPSGGMANLYAYLARANVALSVTLTAISCLVAIVTTPLALASLQSTAAETTGFNVPIGMLAGQLSLLLVLPILTGMTIRRRWPDVSRRHGRILLGFSFAALVALLAFVIVQQAEQFASMLANLLSTAVLMTVLAFGAGWMTGWACGGGASDRFTIGMVFVVRNVGIATAIAVTILGKVEFAVFATAYFLAQTPLLLASALGFRRLRVNEETHMTGRDHS